MKSLVKLRHTNSVNEARLEQTTYIQWSTFISNQVGRLPRRHQHQKTNFLLVKKLIDWMLIECGNVGLKQ